MNIEIITIFPEMFTAPFEESIIKRAKEQNLVTIHVHNLRNWANDVHKSVDDRPYGGGAGMVMRVDVIDKALTEIKSNLTGKTKTILLSAKGSQYTQSRAEAFATLDNIILIAGHYEGVDERVSQYLVDEEVRVGNYVLTGGELPAMIITDSVVRLIPGVLGNEDSAVFESHSEPGYLEHPHYTRPLEYKGWKVPEVLTSGHHAQIEQWRQDTSRFDK